MNMILWDISIVALLILFNGFFSGAEMALISLRKTRITQLAKEGNKRAILAKKTLQEPESFLATVQIGITLISTIASVFAGARIADFISPLFRNAPIGIIAENAEVISLAVIVACITYLSIVLGELIPKSLGLKFSEKFSLAVIYPLYLLSVIFYPFTKLLTASSNMVLKLFGDKTSFSEASLTQEELRSILYESRQAGTLKKYEHEILDNVFDFADMAVNQIMTPRSKIFAVDINDPYEKNIHSIVDSGYTRIPVYKDRIDNIIGVLNTKLLLKRLESNREAHTLAELLQEIYFVPNTQRISDVLKKMQKGKVHLAVVTEEHGDVDGIVTIEDILEEIVGDIDDEGDEQSKLILQEKDDRFQVQGSVSIVDFNKYFQTNLPEDGSYTTISGLLLATLEKIPEVGTVTIIGGIEFTIREITERVIKTVMVKKTIGTQP